VTLLRCCTVTIQDLNEVAHSLDLAAGSLYEAVAQALAALPGHEWVGEIGKGLATITVKVKQPEVTHVVKMQDLKTGCIEGARAGRHRTESEIA